MRRARSLVHCHFSLASTTKAAPYRCHFVQAFEIVLLSIRSVQNALIILTLFLQMVWIVKFTRPNSRHFSFKPSPHPTPPRPFSISHITFTFFFDTQHLVLVTIAMLSRYQSPVTCRSRRVETNFTHKVNYRYYCHFQAWNLYRYPKELEGLPSQ